MNENNYSMFDNSAYAANYIQQPMTNNMQQPMQQNMNMQPLPQIKKGGTPISALKQPGLNAINNTMNTMNNTNNIPNNNRYINPNMYPGNPTQIIEPKNNRMTNMDMINKMHPDDIEDKSKINDLLNDINRELNDFKPSSKTNSFSDEESQDSDNESCNNDDCDNEKINNKSKMYTTGYDAVLIFVIYFILSQQFVKKTLLSYLPMFDKIETNNSQITIIFFGLLIAVLYLFFKNIL